MARQSRILTSLLVLAGASSTVGASKKSFSVHDDLLAFPQFQVLFPDEYILEPQARKLLEGHSSLSSFENSQEGISGQKRSQVYLGLNNHDFDQQDESPDSLDTGDYTLEEMILGDQRYLCQIPQVQLDERVNGTGNDTAEADEQKELARATDRGLELLREMEGKCMYYISGWWSYSFCYKEKVKQFHALPSGSGVPNYPPMEDPTTQSFVLGRFPLGGGDGAEEEDDFAHTGESTHKKATASTTDVAELQTKGGSRYLVQRLDGGTRCDLTGRRRKIEVQFHCHPQSTDRIGWIKETATCSYLMIIYTPRLCNDAVFLPPQQDEIHEIECRQILTPDQVSDWKALREALIAQEHAEDAGLTQEPFPVVGDIEVGAQRLVGSEGKKIEKGRVASAGEEKVDIVAKRENGQVYQRTREELLKYDIDPDKLEDLKKGVDEMAEGKDWKLELITVNGERHLNVLLEEPEQAQVEDDQGPSVHVTSFGPSDDQYKLDKPGNEGADSKAATAEGAAEEPSEKSDEPEKRPSSESDASETGSEEVFKDEL
ncbi:PRKCSH domain-containing protein [Aspergillus aculeatinus CBS 121060]|uniref:Protein OS-9 n=1 Tax=Aspergillus aculeatinus CBS 121060 TaxID=1448322 RepID=A0ACD1HBD3_9EURO|nr:protein OS-9 [Aspergillus aculeatinus CBS 121060]RAH70816.1 protein OS-9 [Aspergillus aculeatinus CBS 121060]